mmetsp:Transcript_31601/g.73691  ORF Transcript_31601/g.73691 Transcript_31601/m.73691 type:complete len:1111 (-) Transcript_31601:174-3506(-)|eukprot:CAMPEP_0178374840 /NCGR_PEP_ID=MMETSP0689_2-20121128/2581_1 /TAXON_ID=160604 /ORGANISM="Amphidinium massartii, Strain CS-259" /LENGTH=1110 /DNA_ID=CAMNT_0019994817 /DNA_START=60 /DNA_END=3392 /DNA_ORIENTATION=-
MTQPQPLFDIGLGPSQYAKGPFIPSHQADRLLKGQGQILLLVEELQRSIDRLPVLLGSLSSVPIGGGDSPERELHLQEPQSAGGAGPMLSPDMFLTNGSQASYQSSQQPGFLRGQGSLRSNKEAEQSSPPVRTTTSARSIVGTSANQLGRSAGTSQSLLSGTGHSFQLLPEFQEIHRAMERTDYGQVEDLAMEHCLAKQGARVSRISSVSFSAPDSRKVMAGSAVVNHLVLHPASKRRGIFDCLIAIFLLLDAVVVPYSLVFHTRAAWLTVASWATACFWSFDMLLNFCTGYIEGNHIEMVWKTIAKRYLRGGFALDFFVLLIEYLNLAALWFSAYGSSGSNNSNADTLQAFKLLRFLKITRLVRLVARLRAGLVSHVDTVIAYLIPRYGLMGWEHCITFAQFLMKLFFVIAWLSHVGSCIWYALEDVIIKGSGTSDASAESWHSNLMATEWASSEDLLYVHGLYWAVSTMFAGSSYLTPLHPLEAAFSMCWLVMGALFVTTITSTLAAKVLDVQGRMGETVKQMRVLNGFMGQCKTPVLLALAVKANFTEKMLSPKRLTELDIPYLSTVTPGLRAALREHQYGSFFLQLPLFRVLNVLSADAVQTSCLAASHVTLVREGQEIFGARQSLEHAILLTHGKLCYTVGSTASAEIVQKPLLSWQLAKTLQVAKVSDPTWISEMALVAEWETVGSLEAAADVELLLVSADSFGKLVRQTSVLAAFVSSYAAGMCEALEFNVRNYGPEGLPTDLDLRVDRDVVVANLHQVVRSALVSLPVIDMMRREQTLFSSMFKRRPLAELEDEVIQGKCHLICGDTPGMVFRVVRVVVLRIVNPEGMLCVQLAEKRGSDLEPKFRLPGRKVEGSCRPADVVQILLNEDLKEMAPFIKLEKVDTVVETHDRGSFRCTTKYIKFIQHAKLQATMEITASRELLALDGNSEYFPSYRQRSHRLFTKKSKSGASSKDTGFHDSLATVCSSPFTTKGVNHCFGFREVASQNQSCDGSNSKNESITKLYRWIQKSDFENLRTREGEVESELMSWLNNGLSRDRLEKLMQWRYRQSEGCEPFGTVVSPCYQDESSSGTAAAFAAASFERPALRENETLLQPNRWSEEV